MLKTRLRYIYLVPAIILWSVAAMQFSTVGSDYDQDYIAGLAWQNNQSVYDTSYGPDITNKLPTTEITPNFHPPTLTAVMLPFSHIQYTKGFFIFVAIAFAFTAAGMLRLFRDLKYQFILSALLLTWFPAMAIPCTGAISGMIFCLFVYAFFALDSKTEHSGALLGVAAALKLYPLIFLPWYLIKRDYAAAKAMLFVFIALQIISFMIIGPADFCRYWIEILPKNAAAFADFPPNQSIYALLTIVTGIKTAALPVTAMLSVFSLWLSSRIQNEQHSFAFLIVCMLLASPLNWNHYLLPTLITFQLILQNTRHNTIRRPYYYAVALAFLMMSAPDVFIAKSFAPEFSMTTHLIIKLPLFGLIILNLAAYLCRFKRNLLWEIS